MIISDTSALVLNWTDPAIWKSQNAINYFNRLDLSAADNLLKLFDDKENYMHTQAVSNRKFFVRKCAVDFLEQNKDGQVIILAAGIAPLSVEISSLYPESTVFDVDKYLMKDKEKFLNGLCPNIRFIECDITNIELLHESLVDYEWNNAHPTMLIMEGIIYYLPKDDLINILKFFVHSNLSFACDFGILPELIDEDNRIFGTEVFRKIKDSVGLDFVNFYDPNEFLKLLGSLGYKLPIRHTMNEIQTERTGSPEPFTSENPEWITCVLKS